MDNFNKYCVLFIIGTRPEAIKLAPVILKFKDSNLFSVNIVLSGQHDEMVRQVMNIFGLKEDINFNLIKKPTFRRNSFKIFGRIEYLF